jgi:hypothetical protein
LNWIINISAKDFREIGNIYRLPKEKLSTMQGLRNLSEIHGGDKADWQAKHSGQIFLGKYHHVREDEIRQSANRNRQDVCKARIHSGAADKEPHEKQIAQYRKRAVSQIEP